MNLTQISLLGMFLSHNKYILMAPPSVMIDTDQTPLNVVKSCRMRDDFCFTPNQAWMCSCNY